MISIIVPAYNVDPWIKMCLDSILKQSYEDIEIIVVNDGSTDNTAEIIELCAHNDDRIRAYHRPNKGVTAARLFGVMQARGEWIGFVDADDYVDSDMYERLIANAQKYQTDISQCGYQLIAGDEVVHYYNTGRLVKQDKQEGVTTLLDGSYIEPGLWNKLFHKRLFHTLLHDDIFDMDIRMNEDLLMNYYLFREAEKSVYEDFCPYHYVLRAGSATTNKISEHKLKDPIRVMQILLQETKENKAQHEAVRRRYIRILCNTATVALGSQADMIRPFRKEMRRALRRELIDVLLKKHYGVRLKVIALWAGILPDTYAWAHRIHIRVNHLDKARNLKK